MDSKELILIRGVSGSGKSSTAKLFNPDIVLEADQYFMHNGIYKFDLSKLREAHKYCRLSCASYMSKETPRIVISNTFTTIKELKPYLELAKEYKYRVTVLIMENYHGNKDVHGVPQEKREMQAKNLKDNMRLL